MSNPYGQGQGRPQQGYPTGGAPPGQYGQGYAQQQQHGYSNQGYPQQGHGAPPGQGYPQQGHGAPPGQYGHQQQAGYGGAAPPGGAYGGHGGHPQQQGGYAPQQGYVGGHQGHPQQGHGHGGYSPYGATQGPVGPPPPSDTFNNAWYADYYKRVDQNQMHTLWLWFQQVDRDRSGSISASELATMKFPGQTGPLAGKPIGSVNAKKAISLFDKDKSQSVDFHEFAAFFQFSFQLQNAFYQGDRDRSGQLDEREVWNALDFAGFKVDYIAAQAYFKKMKGPRGMSIQQFVTLGFTMAEVKHQFIKYDKNKDGKLSLDEVYQITAGYAKKPTGSGLQCTIF